MIDIENIDWDKFVLAKSGRAIKLLYDKESVQFCTSSLYTPFGVKSVEKDWSTFSEYSIDCSLNSAQSVTANSFKAVLQMLDEKIKELVDKQPGIFNKGNDQNFVYSPMLRENGTYPKLIKLQITRDKNGNFTSVIFDENKNKMVINESNIAEALSKGKVFKCIIECAKVWCFNDKVGTIWNIVQLKFSEKTLRPSLQSNPYTTLMID